MTRYIDADKLKIKVSYGQMREDDVLLVPLRDVYKSIYTAPTADVKEIQKAGEWEMFDLISSAYFGKGMYFKQDNGTVYSRYSCKHMSVDEALREFVSLIDDSDLPTPPEREKGKWVHLGGSDWCCSVCGHVISTEGSWEHPLERGCRHCERCGAIMEANDEQTH